MSAGLEIQAAMAGDEHRRFPDIGTVIYYLRAVGWAIRDHEFADLLLRLRQAGENTGIWPLTIRSRSFLLIATKP